MKNEGGAELENAIFVTCAKLMLMDGVELSELVLDTIICDEYNRAGAEKWRKALTAL